MISKLALPAPMIIPALNQMVCKLSGRALNISPVSIRLNRCRLAVALTPNPPRYTRRFTPAAIHASRKLAALCRSRSSKSWPDPMEWMR